MSQRNVERARELYEAWNCGGVDAMVADHWDPEIVWHDFPESPDRDVHRGAPAVAAYVRGVMAVFGHFRVEAEECRSIGDRVLAQLRMAGSGQGGGTTVETSIFHLLEFREGRVARVRAYFDRAQALAAAGQEA